MLGSWFQHIKCRYGFHKWCNPWWRYLKVAPNTAVYTHYCSPTCECCSKTGLMKYATFPEHMYQDFYIDEKGTHIVVPGSSI